MQRTLPNGYPPAELASGQAEAMVSRGTKRFEPLRDRIIRGVAHFFGVS